MIGLDTICLPARRAEIAQRMADNGRDIVELSHAQISEFAGNAIELTGSDGPVLALSGRAWAALRLDQKSVLQSHAQILPLSIPTIEMAGGSVRCMLAGIHLTARPLH